MPLLAQPGGPPASDDAEAEPPTLLDVLWPKKEAPALIKWYVMQVSTWARQVYTLHRT